MSRTSTGSQDKLLKLRSTTQKVSRFLSRTPALVIVSGLFTTLVMAYALRIWRADIFIPFSTDNDALYWQTLVRNFLETGSFFSSNRLDMLGGSAFYGQSGSDALHYLLLAILALLSRSPAATVNIYYLLSFPLATMSAVYTLRKLDTTKGAAFFCGVLYAFLPYHFWQGTAEPLLSGYFTVPLAVLLILKIQEGSVSVALRGPDRGIPARLREQSGLLPWIIIAILVCSSGLDYAFFFLLLAVVALAYRILRDRKWTMQSTGGAIIIVIGWLTIISNRLPIWIARMTGCNIFVPEKAISDAETYSLKFIDLIIPNAHHQLGRFRNMVEVFHRAEPLLNENISTALGVLGAAGIFAALAAPVILWRKDTTEKKLLISVSVLAFAALLLSTLGGFGSILYRYVYDGVPYYYRMVVFLSFLAHTALALIIDATLYAKGFTPQKTTVAPDKVKQRHLFSSLTRAAAKGLNFWRKNRAKLSVLLVPLLLLGLFDTIPVNSAFPYAATRQEQSSLTDFFARAEAVLPADTKVFVLPIATLPATDTPAGTNPYANAEAYLMTSTLRFSYGAIPGSASDQLQRSIAALSAAELVEELRALGYGAIYIDLLRSRDDALIAKKNELVSLATSEPIVTEDGLMIFLPI